MYTLGVGFSYLITIRTNILPTALELIEHIEGNIDWKSKGDFSNNPDIYTVNLEKDKKSIGIAEVKKSIKFLSEKPFQEKNRYLIIAQANKMTNEAQNSLLKILEEVPEYACIILGTSGEGELLETVQSRCKKKLYQTKTKPIVSKQREVFNLSKGERLVLADELSKLEKEEIIEFLNELSQEFRRKVKENSIPNAGKSLEKIAEKTTDITKLNVNVRLALEDLLINLETNTK